MTPKYRADIDGLRAIAVLSVIFFHAGTKLFSGGYVGVDIFFVISGYLITSIIVREIENGDFSVAKFYERRFRRILPALTVVVIVSIIPGVLFLNSQQLYDFSQSIVASSLFSSNILFYLESGYFDGAIESKPLLHTWSLAVEEQYYIFFPLLMMLIAKKDPRKYAKWLIPLALISFSLCVISMDFNPSGTFYLIPTRTWELLVGSLLAVNIFPEARNQYIRNYLSITGFLLTTFSIFFYSSETKFPGAAAAIPTIGAALIIYSGIGGKSFVGKLLSLKPIVFIGLISYSLYLWHWPVIVYTNHYLIVELSNFEVSVMLFVIFSLSLFTWRYVETPFRKKYLFAKRRSLFNASATVSVIIICIGFSMILTEGLPNRYNFGKNSNVVSDDSEWQHWGNCQNVRSKLKREKELCNIGVDGNEESFMFWGDSHAMALASAVDHSAKKFHLTGKIATESACPPLLFIERPNRHSCDEFNQAVLQYISDRPNIKIVILAARWALSTNGTRYKREPGLSVKLVDLQLSGNSYLTNINLFDIGLRRTIDSLIKLGKKVVLVGQVPEVGYDVPSVNYVTSITKREIKSLISPTLSEYNERVKNIKLIFTTLKKEKNVKIIEPYEYLCDREYCNVIEGNNLLYRDDDHLSTYGSIYVSRIFDDIFSE